MKKRTWLVLVLMVAAAAGAFADFGLGLIGSLYMDDVEWEAASGRSIADAFRDGEGIYYGLMGEFMGPRVGLGLSVLASVYESAWGDELVDADLNAYLVGHVLGSRTVLDPMVEVGLGYIAKDYADSDFDDDPDNPIAATKYWFLGAGLGVNLGPVGFYTKFDYHLPLGAVQGTGDLFGYDIEAFGLKPYKVVIGAKLLFPLIPRA
jgi:hypothetical protein